MKLIDYNLQKMFVTNFYLNKKLLLFLLFTITMKLNIILIKKQCIFIKDKL